MHGEIYIPTVAQNLLRATTQGSIEKLRRITPAPHMWRRRLRRSNHRSYFLGNFVILVCLFKVCCDATVASRLLRLANETQARHFSC